MNTREVRSNPRTHASRPEPTTPNHRFVDVRADEVRVRDVVRASRFVNGRWVAEDGWVASVTVEGNDDVVVTGHFAVDWEPFNFTTSFGNGVHVVGRGEV